MLIVLTGVELEAVPARKEMDSLGELVWRNEFYLTDTSLVRAPLMYSDSVHSLFHI